MNDLIIPIFILLLASVFQGTFGLGMKYVKPMAWEAWWVIHVTIAMILVPIIWAFIVTPDLMGVLGKAPSNEVWAGSLLGFVWGIGGIMFGVSVGYIGVGLTYGIVMGVCSIAGALITHFQKYDGALAAHPSYLFLYLGLALFAVGVYIATLAGVKRDKLSSGGEAIEGVAQGDAFKKGLGIAIACGVLSAMLAVGFAQTEQIGKIAQEAGATEQNSALARWVVVLIGAFIMNIGYALFLLFKNNSFGSFSAAGIGKPVKWAIISALLWFGALGTSGQAFALIGVTIGWPTFLALSIIVANIIGVMTGEWKGAKAPFKLMVIGIIIIIAAAVVMTYSSSLTPSA